MKKPYEPPQIIEAIDNIITIATPVSPVTAIRNKLSSLRKSTRTTFWQARPFTRPTLRARPLLARRSSTRTRPIPVPL